MGQDVVALGFPLGQNSLKISKGCGQVKGLTELCQSRLMQAATGNNCGHSFFKKREATMGNGKMGRGWYVNVGMSWHRAQHDSRAACFSLLLVGGKRRTKIQIATEMSASGGGC